MSPLRKWYLQKHLLFQESSFRYPTSLPITTTWPDYTRLSGNIARASRCTRLCPRGTSPSPYMLASMSSSGNMLTDRLSPPYRGPYAVLESNPKAYRLSIARGSDWVSIDRLKPAYLEEEEPAPPSPLAGGPASTEHPMDTPAHASPLGAGPRLASSRAGRPIRQPNRLNL